MTVTAKTGDMRSRDANNRGGNSFEIFIVMSWDRSIMSILLAEAHPIPLHAIAAMVAVILGGIRLYMKKGGAIHKLLGRLWVGLMLVVSV